MIVLVASFALFGAIAALTIAVLLWMKLREAHRRLHLLTEGLATNAQQLVQLSRSACRLEAFARFGARVDGEALQAQHGEEYFLWERFGFKRAGVFVEIGAYNGVSLSNSYFFEQMGWKGMLVEAHPDLVEQCRKSRPASVVVHAALGAQDAGEVEFSMAKGADGIDTLSFSTTSDGHRRRIERKGGWIESVAVPARTLKSLLAEHRITSVDWVSVDVEGAEIEVLRGAGLDEFQPAVLMIEDNSGGMDTRVRDFLLEVGYRRVLSIGCNDLYERRS